GRCTVLVMSDRLGAHGRRGADRTNVPRALDPVHQAFIDQGVDGLPDRPAGELVFLHQGGLGEHNPARRPSPEAAVFWGMLGALAGYLIHRTWHQAWVRATVTGSFAFVETLVVSCLVVCVVQAIIAPNQTANDGIPVFIGASRSSLVIAAVAGYRAVVG